MLCQNCGRDIPPDGSVCPYCRRETVKGQGETVIQVLLGVGFGFLGLKLFSGWGAIAGVFLGFVLALVITKKVRPKAALVFVTVSTLLIGSYWIYKGDWRKIVINGQTVTVGECKNDLLELESLEGSIALPNPYEPSLVKTDIPEKKIGACGTAALSALKSYFYYKDDLTNLRQTMSLAMTSNQIDEATSSNKRLFDEAKRAYNAELAKLRLLVK